MTGFIADVGSGGETQLKKIKTSGSASRRANWIQEREVVDIVQLSTAPLTSPSHTPPLLHPHAQTHTNLFLLFETLFILLCTGWYQEAPGN